MQTAKIAKLPRHIREQINQRLDRSETDASIAAWLNTLPEVQAVLAAEFNGEPVKRQNVQSWKKHSFPNWQLAQSALTFTNDALPDDISTATLEQMSAKLIRYMQMRYAALAASLPSPDKDPEGELARLSVLCTNLTALRRGDLTAQRLAIEKERLLLEKSRAKEDQEALFWTWTQRPDVQENLYPHRDPDQVRRNVDRLITEHMLGIRHSAAPENAPDPACFI